MVNEGECMKVTIVDDGCLEVTAETYLENYALTKWFDGYNNQRENYPTIDLADNNAKETLMIKTYKVEK